MTTSPNGRKLIIDFEGVQYVAYKDQRGIWTCGVGHTGPEVVEGTVCTEAQAEIWLEADLATAEGAVNKVPAPLNCNQFDALVSLCFNIGSGNFHSSTVYKRLSLSPPDYVGACDAIDMWKITAGEENPGLERRRQAEMALFLTPVE